MDKRSDMQKAIDLTRSEIRAAFAGLKRIKCRLKRDPEPAESTQDG